jgi:hypothetical protein
MHAIAKIIPKMLANRLAPFMNTLASRIQSTFIKTKSIHDNFMYLMNYARRLHKARVLAFSLKL